MRAKLSQFVSLVITAIYFVSAVLVRISCLSCGVFFLFLSIKGFSPMMLEQLSSAPTHIKIVFPILMCIVFVAGIYLVAKAALSSEDKMLEFGF